MKNSNQKTFSLVTLILITLLCLPIFAFALGNNKGVSTTWRVEARALDNEYMGEALILQKASGSGSISKIYMYIGNVNFDRANDNKISFTVTSSSNENTIIGDSLSSFSTEKLTLDIPANKFNSWVEIPITRAFSGKYLKIIFSDDFELYEVACFTQVKEESGEVKEEFVPVECYGAKIWKTDGKYAFVKASDAENDFIKACDEQDQFTMTATAKGLSSYELRLAGAINNVLNADGYYVSESENVLSVLINIPAVVLFGQNSFGLRITGFIFFLLTLYVIFFFVKKIFESNLYAVLGVVLYLVSCLPLSLVTNANGVTIAVFFLLCSISLATTFFKRATTAKRVRVNAKLIVLSGVLFSLALATSLYSLFAVPAIAVLLIYPSVKGLIEIVRDYKQSEGLEKEYLREKNVKTWWSVILSLFFGFILMPFVVLYASYGLAFATYCEYYGKNIFAVLFANHARIFASQPKGLFLAWIIGLGQLEYSFPMGASVYAFANRVLTCFALIALITLSVLYLLQKCKAIKNGDLLVALRDNQLTYVIINLAFASTYFLNVFLWGSNSYASFAMSLIFLLLNVLLAHNILKFVLPKTLIKAMSITILTIVGIFFAFQLVLIFKINLPEQVQPIFNWLIQ